MDITCGYTAAELPTDAHPVNRQVNPYVRSVHCCTPDLAPPSAHGAGKCSCCWKIGRWAGKRACIDARDGLRQLPMQRGAVQVGGRDAQLLGSRQGGQLGGRLAAFKRGGELPGMVSFLHPLTGATPIMLDAYLGPAPEAVHNRAAQPPHRVQHHGARHPVGEGRQPKLLRLEVQQRGQQLAAACG